MKKFISFLSAAIYCCITNAATQVPIQLLNPAGSTSGQAIVSTGAGTAPAWGSVAATSLGPQAANTVVGNFTGSSASPTAYAMPSCASGSALTYTSGTGIICSTGYALLASPAFTGSPTAPNQTAGDNTTKLANTAYVQSAVSGGAYAGSFLTLASTNGTTVGNGLTVSAGGASITGGLIIASGSIVPVQTSGITGTTTNNNASAGSVGEYPNNTTSGTSMTTGTPANCTSQSLTAGDYDVQGVVQFSPGASTTVSQLLAGISTTSATFGGFANNTVLGLTFTTGAAQTISTPVVRVSLSGTTTVYVVGQSSFGVSTMACNGFIRARRVR